ncbi:MAG: hypothetical protein QM655_05705 [Nocardioidaceae bacterium]
MSVSWLGSCLPLDRPGDNGVQPHADQDGKAVVYVIDGHDYKYADGSYA